MPRSRWAFAAAAVAVVAAAVALCGRRARANGARLDEIIAVLYRQAARWAVASEQDASAVIAVLHANYGAGYLWALKDIVTPEEFARATGGADFLALERRIVAIQDAAARKLLGICGAAAPVSDEALVKAMYYRAPSERGADAAVPKESRAPSGAARGR